MADNSQQRSALKDFLSVRPSAPSTSSNGLLLIFQKSIATIKGDLSNITAPPFVLAPQSTTSLPLYWAEYPSLFSSISSFPSPGERILQVTKWFLLCLRRQQYGPRPASAGAKKPLNAFLGELFLASFGEGKEKTFLVAEQVSHHPPVTACSLRADGAGVRADGFAGQRITFSGNVHVRQAGHAVLSVSRDGEDEERYVVPLPDVTVSGVVTGTAYPELGGKYVLPSSSGWRAEVEFSGKRALGLLGGEKHHVLAEVFGPDGQEAVYKIEGVWDGKMVVTDAQGKEIETMDSMATEPVEPELPKLEEQSPWESRRAWADVVDALERGDMQATADAKNKLEEAQRAQRKRREEENGEWKPLFFRREKSDPRWEALKDALPEESRKASQEAGFWVVDETNKNKSRPFRDGKPWEE